MKAVNYVTTASLKVAYYEWGAGGRPVVLVHGWPDDALTWRAVCEQLSVAGYHLYMPYLRGCGPTEFRSAAVPRSGQLAALGRDLIEFTDALGLGRCTLIGHDWGARAAYIASCLWPERLRACVALSVGWGTNRPAQTLSFDQARRYWYHWFMATDRGEAAVRTQAREFTRYIWDLWCPFWKIDPAELERTQAAFDNPDWAEITLHSYRHRWGFAGADPQYDTIERRLANPPLITVPTLVLHGADDPANSVETSAGREQLFLGPYTREVIEHCGHFPQREQPQAVCEHLLPFLDEYA